MMRVPSLAQGQPQWYYGPGKRALDLLGASLGLIGLGLVFLPLAAAIALDSPGPILFVQVRVGKDRRPFRLVKFRTMRVDGPRPGSPPLGEEARVTALGRFLRRTALDELPQFVNVLRGEMSLVGPRPELPVLFAAYAPWQQRRVEVLPGMTGWWQVNGRRQPMRDHVHYDLWYIDHRSLAFDLRILLLTVPALVGANARRDAPPAAHSELTADGR